MTTTNRPNPFVLVSTNHGTMLVNRNDYSINPDGYSIIGVGLQLLNNSTYDPGEIDLALRLLQLRRKYFGDGVVAIDCGANIGVHSIEWAKLMHGWGSVMSFEPQLRIFYALAGNITLNNCFNATAYWAAVGAENGSIKVPVPDYCRPASFGSLELRKSATNEFIGQAIDYSDARTMATPLHSIDGFGLNRIDFIKIDIEGMEMEALAGARSALARLRPQLLIEKIKSNEDALISFVASRGYETFPIGANLLAIHDSDPALKELKQT